MKIAKTGTFSEKGGIDNKRNRIEMISNNSSLLAALSLGDPEAEQTIHYSRWLTLSAG